MHHHAKGPRGGDPRKPFQDLPAAGKRGGESSTAQLPTSQDSAKSWRDVLPVHPAAELFPLMSPDELRTLGEDIIKSGLTSPIALWRADFDRLARYQLDGVEAIATVEQLLRRFRVGVPQRDGAGEPVLDDVRAQLFQCGGVCLRH